MNEYSNLHKTLSLSSHYQGEKGKKYISMQIFKNHHEGYRLQSEFFQPHISLKAIVLDFGCGNGGIMKYIKCKEVSGFEINSYAVAKARELGVVNKIYNDIKKLPKNYFTVIYSNHVLEHVLCPVAILKKCRQCLKKNGLLILLLPLDDWKLKKQRDYNFDDIDHHLYTWTPRLLCNLLCEAGYKVVEIKIITSAWSLRLLPLYKLPLLGRFARHITALLLRRRQIKALAVKTRDE